MTADDLAPTSLVMNRQAEFERRMAAQFWAGVEIKVARIEAHAETLPADVRDRLDIDGLAAAILSDGVK